MTGGVIVPRALHPAGHPEVDVQGLVLVPRKLLAGSDEDLFDSNAKAFESIYGLIGGHASKYGFVSGEVSQLSFKRFGFPRLESERCK